LDLEDTGEFGEEIYFGQLDFYQVKGINVTGIS
jgi:hypothetical protein